MSRNRPNQYLRPQLENHSRACRASSTPPCRRSGWARSRALLHANAKAAALIGLDPKAFRRSRFLPSLFRPSCTSGRFSSRWRWSIPAISSAPGRGSWAMAARLLIGAGAKPPRRIVGRAAQRLRQDALFALRRWPRGDALHHPRISVQRGDGGLGHSHHAARFAIIATGETVHARGARAGRGADPAGALAYPLRPFRAFPSHAASTNRCALLADHVIAGIFAGICGRLCRLVRRSGETHRRIDGANGRRRASPMA